MNTQKKRFLKGFLGVALSVLTAVSSCPITAFAAEEKSSNMTSDFTFTNNGSVTYSGATLGNFTVKGVNDSKEKNATRQAFCVENSKSNPTRANLGNFQKSSDTKLAKAIYYGWVADSNNATVKKVYGNYANDKTARMVITSAALSQLYSGNSYGNSGNAAIQKSNLIAVAKDSKTTIPNNNISLTDNDLSVSVKNNLQVSQTTQLKGYSGNSVSVTVPKDMTLVNETQNKKVTNGKATIKVNDKFHFEAPLSYSGTINASLKGGMYDFAAYVAKSKSSGIQSIATYCWASNSSSAQVKATFTARLGNLEIIKDSSNHSLTDNSDCYSLKGAVFEVTNTNTKKKYTATANTKVNDGSATTKYKAVLNNIPVGEYTIKEKTAPKGYALSTQTQNVTVKAGKTASTITFKNVPQSDPMLVLLEKTNGNGKAIAGAEFTVRYYKGYFTKEEIESGKAENSFKRYWTVKTDNDGYAELNKEYLVESNNDFYYTANGNITLPLGTVTIQETKAPAGYIKDNTLYVQQITSNNSLEAVSTYNEFTNVNNPSTYYNLIKTSEDGVVAGVSFKIYEGNKVNESKYLKTVKTGSNGEIKEKLDVGTYTFDEVVSDKYIKQPAKTVTITAENTSAKPAEISFSNKLKDGKLKISKTASDGNIAGITFEVYKGSNTAGQLVGTYVTDDSGLITKDIKADTYCIHEIVPAGYRPVSDQVITIKPNEERTVTFRNVKSGSQVKIIKETDNYDAGPFTCMVEGISNDLKMDIDIDSYEPTIINLEDGRYRITEILTDEQKALWQEIKPIEFIVDHNKELTTVTLQNHEKTGSVKVIKTASDNYIEGKQFSLYGVSSAGFEIKYCYATTNKDGIAVFDNIPVGKYVLEEVSSHAIYNLKSDVDLNGVVVEWDKVTEVNIRNDEKTTPFEVVKTSEDGNLKGFEFEITGTTTSGDSVKLTNLITDDKGRITGNLYPGTYEAREVKTPNKYIQPSEQKFTIEQTTNDNPAPVQLFFYNELKKGSLEITKTAYDGFIENVAFSLTSKEDSSVVYHAITNAKGIAKFENIPIGAYKLREENIGEQYIEIGDINVVINYNEITKQSVENKPKDGYLKVIKTSDSKNLKGFEFEVTGKTWDNKEIKESYTTDEKGLIVEKLPTGTYTVEEINVPSYFKVPAQQTFELTPYYSEDEPLVINMDNEYKKGNLIVRKSSEDGQIADVVFTLNGTADNGEAVDIEVATNEFGIASFEDVPIGKYILDEVSGPQYVRFEKQEIQINEDEIAYYNAKNVLRDVPVEVIKTSDYGVIEGVKIRVQSLDENLPFDKTFTTDKNGKIATNLHPAQYKFTELEVPVYAVPQQVQVLDVKPYGTYDEPQSVKFDNLAKRGNLIVKKSADDKFIEGIKFALFGTADNGEFINLTAITDKSGIAKFNDVPIGKYTLSEITKEDRYITVLDMEQTIEWKTTLEALVENHLKIGEISTTAKCNETQSNYAYAMENVTLVDTVSYKGLGSNTEYRLEGVLMDKATGEVLDIEDSSKVRSIKDFTTTSTGSGTVDVEFTIPAESLKGKSVVVFEYLSYKDKDGNYIDLANHTDITDTNQTIIFKNPSVGTTAKDTVTNTNEAFVSKTTTIVDTVNYTDLIVGKEYTISGVLMNKATNEPLVVNGNEVTATKTFTAAQEDGSIDIEFTFDSSALAGEAVVAFETLTYNGEEIATHTDITDKGQTVTFAEPPTEPTIPTEPTKPTTPPTVPTVPTQPADSTVPPATEQTTVPGAGIDSNIPGAGIATGETDYLYIIAALCATLAFVIIIFAKKTNEK